MVVAHFWTFRRFSHWTFSRLAKCLAGSEIDNALQQSKTTPETTGRLRIFVRDCRSEGTYVLFQARCEPTSLPSKKEPRVEARQSAKERALQHLVLCLGRVAGDGDRLFEEIAELPERARALPWRLYFARV